MKYVMGLDGGGTKTSAAIFCGQAECARVTVGGINYNSYPKEQIREQLETLARECRTKGYLPELCEGIGIGAAGTSNLASERFLKDCFRTCGFSCPIHVMGDHEAALRGGLPGQAGILVIAGTGSICVARNRVGEMTRVGGYGHLIDDEGSAYAIGRDILCAVVRAGDRREEATALSEAVFRMLGIGSLDELIGFVYAPETGKKKIAGLAVLLSEGMIRNDRAAERIAQKAACELTRLVLPAASWLKETESEGGETEKYPILVAGGVLERNLMVRSFFEEQLEALLVPVFVAEREKDAAYGAASPFLERAVGNEFSGAMLNGNSYPSNFPHTL